MTTTFYSVTRHMTDATKPLFGDRASVLFLEIAQDAVVLDVIEDIVSDSYGIHLGEEGVRFARLYCRYLRELPVRAEEGHVLELVHRLRAHFRSRGLLAMYNATFRPGNLRSALGHIPSELFQTSTLDFGSDDNLLGLAIIDNSDSTASVVGVDIAARNPAVRERLSFRRQRSPDTIPAADDAFDLAISRYVLHHIQYSLHSRILAELCRVVRPGGYVAVFENTLALDPSASWHYANSPDSPFAVLTPNQRYLVMAGLDIFSLGAKGKNQPFPFAFRDPMEWNSLFVSVGLDLQRSEHWLLPHHELHPQPSSMFLLRCPRMSCRNGAGDG